MAPSLAPCQAVLDTEMKDSSCGRNKAKGKQAEARPELPQAYLGRPREPSPRPPAPCKHLGGPGNARGALPGLPRPRAQNNPLIQTQTEKTLWWHQSVQGNIRL